MTLVEALIYVGLPAATVGIAIGRGIRDSKNEVAEKKDETPSADNADGDESDQLTQQLFALGNALNQAVELSSHPRELHNDEAFTQGVQLLANPDVPLQRVVDYCLGSNWHFGMVAAAALAERPDSGPAVDRILNHVGEAPQWPLYFRLLFIDARAEQPVIGRVIASVEEEWARMPITVQVIGEFLRSRVDKGEDLSFGNTLFGASAERLDGIVALLRRMDPDLAKPLLKQMSSMRAAQQDFGFLRSVGRVFTNADKRPRVFHSETVDRYIGEMGRAFRESPPRSVLLVGDSGVGKTALRDGFAHALAESGWRVLETSGAGLIADKFYIGQIEGQVQKLVAATQRSKHIAVYIDRLQELATIGRARSDDDSLLDQLWPHLETHEIFLVSEATPQAYQALLRKYPSLAIVMKVIQVQPMSERESISLANDFVAVAQPDVPEVRRDATVADAFQLADQYLSHKALPGRGLALLELGVARAQTDALPISRDHLLTALSELTGLPRDVLDDDQALDLDKLRGEFEKRIVGQSEAIECLVERVSMLKAGLTDPKRPIGVFLFAGPTGTGKTEIAKTLAQILFGAEEQMIRLDMSEFQTADSVPRLLQFVDESGPTASLVNLIRKQPFSVVLLDEFEKAHMKVWDIFLQVFDDGRLTDSQGNLADFRHAIIILTSNLGATISSEAGVGFTGVAGQFSPKEVMRAVQKAFRPEFINRLDRVVVFSPLSRETMRGILQKELDKAITRRGLRSKAWVVEWEDSAVEFLLRKGFTPDLGARPLRRAIEQYLLAPLSMTIVEHRAPEGDQFLFVRSDGEDLQVEFVDPDSDYQAPEAEPADKPSPPTSAADLVLHATGTDAECRFLHERVRAIQQRLEDDEWETLKAACLDDMNADGFWDRTDRHDILGRLELMDRVESAAAYLEPLADRLTYASGAQFTRQVAQKLYVLEEGLQDVDSARPTQAILGLRILREDSKDPRAPDFLDRLTEMYRRWARERRMNLAELRGDDTPGSRIFYVTGFGSYGILDREAGLHVLETPAGATKFDRVRVRVVVAPDALPGRSDRGAQLEQARKALKSADNQGSKIVRRYRKAPSPLVRDDVYGWRTGNIESIWAGNFDVSGGPPV